jgi:uncharacterized membrane-anchored protein
MNGDALVSDYLGRLDAAAWPLPPERRSELASEVREHIEAALSEAGSRDEVTVPQRPRTPRPAGGDRGR